MFIRAKKGIDIHWWGHSLLLIDHLVNYYTFTPEESMLMKYLAISNDVDATVKSITRDLPISQEDVIGFIDIFLDNFTQFFQRIEQVDSDKISITGKEGMYYPLELHISLTNSCLHQCIHCYKSANRNGSYIDYEALISFLDRMSGFTPYLTLSGGEPTLHPCFCELLEKYEKKYSRVVK